MTQLSEMGAVIAPPVPAFYTQPATIDATIAPHGITNADRSIAMAGDWLGGARVEHAYDSGLAAVAALGI